MAILFGTDLSPAAREASMAAAAFAARLGLPLCLVHSLGDAEHVLDVESLAALRGAVDRRLQDEARRIAGVASIPVETAIVAGNAARSLLEFASARGAQLLVVASRGHGASPLLRVGGTSERIALDAAIPTVVVRAAEPFVRWMTGERPLRVVIGMDFTSSAAAAWRWLSALRAAAPCDVVAAHLYYADEAATRYGPGDVEPLLVRDVLACLGELPGLGSFTVRAQVAAGRLADHLVELADEERADLVVMGTHHRHHAARLWSVSGGVLHMSRAAVATIPATAQPAAPVRPAEVTHVLVATDLREPAPAAVALAYGILRGRAGNVHLLHVASFDADAPDRGDADASLEQQLRALAPVEGVGQGVTTTVEVAHGPVARTISEVAERLGADLICVASRRRGRAAIAGGSVVQELLRRTTRPVVVVRPPPR